MLKQKIAVFFAAFALLTGLGVASAFADDHQPSTPTTTVTTTTAENQDDQGQDEQGQDEQTSADDVEQAANAVENEAGNPSADDQDGDQQASSDQNEEGD